MALSAPSESWDDDFDFRNPSAAHKRRINAAHDDQQPATIRMSTATEDWDADDITSTTTPFIHHDSARPPNTVFADKLNIVTPNLQDWVEPDPRTPQKASFPADIVTENWDDDFLDKRDSPARPSTHTPSRNSISRKLRVGVPLRHHPARKSPHHSDEEHESWDDEFDFNHSPAKPSTPRKQPRPQQPLRHLKHKPSSPASSSSSVGHHHHDISDDDDGVGAGFGRASNEEDRTVTACSKRAPQAHSPPPPVPAIPFILTPLLPTHSSSTSTNAPFPRSPTTSVFSVPTPSIADTTSLRSTAPLRPSLSRNPGGTSNTLKHLPPSPPIHRERRRLRKKSRPQPQGMIELLDMSRSNFFSDTEAELRIEECDERRTPSPPPVSATATAADADTTGASVPQTPLQSQAISSTGGALLSRIGSVKRWTTRRKRASTTPSEVAKDGDKSKDADNADDRQTPRPHPSLSSLLLSAPVPGPPPPPSSSWFFHSSSPNQGRVSLSSNNNIAAAATARSSFTGSRSGSTTDLSMRGSIYASSSIYGEDEQQHHSVVQRTPNKLVKRKSVGFVQLNKELRARGRAAESGKSEKSGRGDHSDTSLDIRKPNSKRPVSMQGQGLPSTMRHVAATQRHASYGTPKAKKPGAITEDLHESGGDRTLPVPNKTQGLPKDEGKEEEKVKGKDKEAGSRGFMGSVRRLSLAGRHKKTKSGASLANMGVLARVPSESSARPATPLDSASDLPPPLPVQSAAATDTADPQPPSIPALLPPIELQPPSPPRNKKEKNTTDSLSTPLRSPIVDMLSPTSPSASAPALASPPSSSKSPKSPESTRARTPRTPRSPVSPQTASLGRTTAASPSASTIAGGVQRRNSLNDLKSDLKIPARISQAQVGLKRDLGMVRDFAVYIEQLKKQQETYHDLVTQVQQKLDAQARLHAQQQHQPASRAVSPSFFNNLSKAKTRARSNTNPGSHPSQGYKELAAAFYTINSKYRISWECAGLLVELADGSSGASGLSPPSSASAPMALNTRGEKRNRERAITLAGDESKPSTPTPGSTPSSVIHPSSTPGGGIGSSPLTSPNGWRASTGRHDLSHRQLTLLREMLNNAEAMLFADEPDFPLLEDSAPSEPESSGHARVNREWKWGDPMSSTVTLPPEEPSGESPKKKRRTSRLGMGMSGLRDMLRALKKGHNDAKDQLPPPLPSVHNHAMLSSASLSTDASLSLGSGGHPPEIPSAAARKRNPKSSSGPESVVKPGKERGRVWEPKEPPLPPYGRSSLAVKASPRRPSLASIFRLGTKKNTPPSASVTDLSMHSCDKHQREISRPTTSLGSIQGQSSSTGEEDWDRMDSASDLDAAAKALEMNLGSGIDGDGGATVRVRKGKSPYLQYQAPSSSGQLGHPTTPRRSASGSQLVLRSESPTKAGVQSATPRAKRLSNVDEGVEGSRSGGKRRERRRSSSRASGKIAKSGSVRSMPPQPVLSDLRIAMTPENIKPLLENAREVHTRLGDCIMEIQRLLTSDILGGRTVSGSSCTTASCV